MGMAGTPKILLAKPGLVGTSNFSRVGTGEDDAVLGRRLPPIASLNLLSDSWDFLTDRILPFLTENTEFTIVGVIGPPGVGKSTILNEIYGFDGSSSGMLPPFAIQSDEIRATARHCTIGIEPRISAERIILLDTQPVFSPSVLSEMMRPDGSSTISVLSGETMSAELAHELMGIQLGILLASICHILLVVSDEFPDINMWRLLSTVSLLKHGIPDPSTLISSHLQSSNTGLEHENKNKIQEEYLAIPMFVYSKLRGQDLSSHNFMYMKKTLSNYFSSSLFMEVKSRIITNEHNSSFALPNSTQVDESKSSLDLFVIPFKSKDDSLTVRYDSYDSMLWKLRDQVLSMTYPSFARTVSERDWLKNSVKIWELVKKSPVILEYSKMLQSSGLFRR